MVQMDPNNSYDKMSRRLEEAALTGKLDETKADIAAHGTAQEKRQADDLLHSGEKPLVVHLGACTCDEKDSPCQVACLFDAIHRGKDGRLEISGECTGCGRCIDACREHVLTGRKDTLPLLELLQKQETPVYAMIAPAFSGQFSADVTSGKLRTAFKTLGFYGMIEVALFADILTLKEALEFDRSIQDDHDFMLTSCCCPMWMALIKKSYSQLIPHVPPSVSPMVAAGRSIKRIHPEAKTVFIGPCLAKKAEAKEADISDAVDYVLTFTEIQELFQMAQIDPAALPEDESDHSSRAGRIYARTTGVSEAVETTLARLRPDKKVKIHAQQADGIIACKELLKEIADGKIQANFVEGMGCKGGCVGGPRAIIDRERGREAVNEYGDSAGSRTPADNPYVLDVLHRLGFHTVEALLDRDNTFTRNF